MYPLFESIKVKDGKLCHPEWHQLRYERSYKKMYKKNPLSHLTSHLTIPAYANEGVFKLRISYNDQLRKIEFEPYLIKEIKTLKLVHLENIDYSSKFKDRSDLLDAYKQKDNCDDVLIIVNNRVTDSSYANIVFFDGTRWVTPTNPLLEGTARARLLDAGIVQTQEIQAKDIPSFNSFKLINALRDFHEVEPIPVQGIIR